MVQRRHRDAAAFREFPDSQRLFDIHVDLKGG
jgi:hypothetical protein